MKQNFSLLLVPLCMLFSMCSKKNEESALNSIKPASNEVGSKIPGPCPYPCPDSRCSFYEFGCPTGTPPEHIVFANQIGMHHNYALNYVTTDNINMSNLNNVYNTLHDQISLGLNDLEIYVNSNDTAFLRSKVLQLMSNNGYLFDFHPQDSVMTVYKNQISPYLTSKERNLFDQTMSIFNVSGLNQGLSDQAVLDTFYNRAYRIKTLFNNTTWGIYEGDAVGGLLNIILSSTQYWKDYLANGGIVVSGTGNPSSASVAFVGPLYMKAVPLPQADALGYLVGWFQSWAIDEEPNGRVRIKAGLWSAAEYSGAGKIIKKYLK